MILQALVDYYEVLQKQGKVPRVGWQLGAVSWGLHLSPEGELLDLVPLMTQAQRGSKTVNVPKEVFLPLKIRNTSEVQANFLVDDCRYMLGIQGIGKKDRTEASFLSSRELHQKILADVNSGTAKSILYFLQNWDITKAREHPVLKPFLKELEAEGNMIFMHQNTHLATEDPAIRDAWDSYYREQQMGKKVHCLVTGKTDKIARIHGAISGIQGKNPKLVSVNADSFCSYGATIKAPNIHVGEYAAFAYVTALNYLISKSDSKQMLGKTTLIYWSGDGNEISQKVASGESLEESEDDLGGLFHRIAEGLPVEDVNLENPFYVLALSPAEGRAIVDFFYRSSLGNLVKNLSKHYERLEIIQPTYNQSLYLSPDQILKEAINPNSKNSKASAQLISKLLYAILHNTRYPVELYHGVMARVRADIDEDKPKEDEEHKKGGKRKREGNPKDEKKFVKKITWRKVAVIKAYLLQVLPEKEREALTMALNEENTNQAYLLGRLFSVLEQLQEKSNAEIKATIKGSRFNSACATPLIAFPQLIKLSHAHSKKASREHEALVPYLEMQRGKIMDSLSDVAPFPSRLDIEAQGLFIVGYYHQTQDRYTKKEKIKDETN